MEDKLFDVFHAKAEIETTQFCGFPIENIKYIIPVETLKLHYVEDEIVEDRIYDEQQFLELENEVIKWFENLDCYCYRMLNQYNHTSQFNFSGNKKLHNILLKIACDNPNDYILDYLICDSLLDYKYNNNDESFSRASLLYGLVVAPSDMPFNSVYKAILFDKYKEFILDDSLPLFETAHQFNLDPKLIMKELRDNNIYFPERNQHEDSYIFWLLEKLK